MPKLEPDDVFTPGKIPTDAMFKSRNERDDDGSPSLEERVTSALKGQGIHVLLHGDSGVGKSSLLELAVAKLHWRMRDVGCYEGSTFDDLVDSALAKMVTVREVSRHSTREGEGSMESTGGVSSFLNVKGRISRRWGRSSQFELLRVEPAEALVKAMAASKVNVLQFDNFHNVRDDRVRLQFGQMIERISTLSDRRSRQTIAIVGIAADAASLLGNDQAHTRRVKAVPVPRMDDQKIRDILATGFRLLEIPVPGDVIDSLVFHADGFPYYAHNLGLLVASAYRQSPSIDPVVLLNRVYSLAAEEVAATYEPRFRLAVESAKAEVAPRRRILEILCSSDKREWTGQDVQRAWDERYGTRTDYSFLWGALGTLAKAEAGTILSRTGTTGRYVYQFSDPHLRPYLRMKFRDV